MQNNLVVFIIGTTASGKTKLSLSLSSEVNYEIVSCDSMQIYKVADIMTAKATTQEQMIKPHHGINLISLEHQGFNRNDWVSYCKQTIEQIQSRNSIPVIVGGTTYYMEPLLFKTSEHLENPQNICVQMADDNLLEQLKSIDPVAAQKFHVNDTRRIKNALKFHKQTGSLPSEIPDFHSSESSMKMDNFLIFWPKWKRKEDLQNKVKTRINSMIHDEGGLQEIIQIFDQLQEKQMIGGVLQSIGYRQFNEAYQYFKQNQKDLSQIKQDQHFVQLLNQGEEQLIQDTMNYTKKQMQWIKNRIICNPNIDIMKEKIFIFEFESEKDFNDCVIKPAREIFSAFVDGNFNKNNYQQYMLNENELQKYKTISQGKQRGNWNKQICALCDKEVNGPKEWDQHIKSKSHQYFINKKRKETENQKKIQLQQALDHELEKKTKLTD